MSDELEDVEVDNPGGIDYERWAKVLERAEPSLCREAGCRRCRARRAEWQRKP